MSPLFAGKVVLQSTAAGAAYLAVVAEMGTAPFPSMSAATQQDATVLTLYGTASGVLIQANGGAQIGGLYLALNTDLGWIDTTPDAASAATFQLTGTGAATTLSVLSPADHAWHAVRYGTNPNPDLAQLTISAAGDPGEAFTQTLITPGVTAMQGSKQARNADLSSVVLRGVVLDGIDFTGGSFNAAVLDGASFAGATLTECTFSGASLTGCNLAGACLDKANLSGLTVSSARWSNDTSARGASFSGSTLVSVTRAQSPSGKSLVLDEADLTDAVLLMTDLGGGSFAQTVLNATTFMGCNLDGVSLAEVVQPAHVPLSFRFCYFGSNASFGAQSLFGADFSYATFDDTISFAKTGSLEQSVFRGAYAADVDFSNANMNGASLAGACLIGADFNGTSLGPSGTRAADLTGAALMAANFAAARLTGAVLTNALISLVTGSFDVRYADENGQLFPSSADWMPMNYLATAGLAQALRDSTFCPNGLTWAVCKARGLSVAEALTAAVAAPNWEPFTRLPRSG